MSGADILFAGTAFIIVFGGYWLVLELDTRWRPVIQAYLEARCQQMGTPMRMPPPAEEPAGKLYPPFPDDDIRDIDDVI